MFFALILLRTSCNAQECRELNQMVNKFNSPLVDKALDKAFEETIKYFLGNSMVLVKKAISPSKIGTPKDQYSSSLSKLKDLIQPNKIADSNTQEAIQKELENLLMAEEGIIIENGYSPGSPCYKALKDLSESIVKLAVSPNGLNICQFYRFFGDLKRGTNCGKDSSARVTIINTASTTMRMSASFQKEDGNWTDWETYNVLSNASMSWWVCSTNGNYIVLGVDRDVNDKYKCKRMSQQMAFDYPKTILD